MSFSDFSKVETLKSLNEFLTEKSYVDGYVSLNLSNKFCFIAVPIEEVLWWSQSLVRVYEVDSRPTAWVTKEI